MELEPGSREGAAMRTKTDLRARGRLSVERAGGGAARAARAVRLRSKKS